MKPAAAARFDRGAALDNWSETSGNRASTGYGPLPSSRPVVSEVVEDVFNAVAQLGLVDAPEHACAASNPAGMLPAQ